MSAESRYALRKSVPLVGGVAVLVLLGLVASWNWQSKSRLTLTTAEQFSPGTKSASLAADPRLTFATPYRNVRPEIKYVGDEACSACHARITNAYRRHPMGRSWSPITKAAMLERYDTAAHNPFVAAGFRYGVERRGERTFHKESALGTSGKDPIEMEAEVQFAVGSGQRARSYLIDRNGYLFASPMSWYSQKGVWDLSPGYARQNPHFGRPIGPDCLFCHANQVEHIEHTANQYRRPLFQGTAIGCERCHGPGELHVKRHQNNEELSSIDDTIVNPRRLQHGLREAVCQQCHLQGEQRILRRGTKYFDYRPGLPLELFFADFIKPSRTRPSPLLAGGEGRVRGAEQQNDTKFVGTVEQMYASRCFRESKGPDKMGCITCHDPHRLPEAEKKMAYYRTRCLSCHEKQSCNLTRVVRLERNKDDNCVACHMPRTGSDVNHTIITDHRILRRPETAVNQPVVDAWPRAGQVPLIRFHSDPLDRDDEESSRDLGVALVELAERQPDHIARQLSDRALSLLERALTNDTHDTPAWEAKGSALWHQGRLQEALAAYEAALKLSADRETTLFLASTLALRLNRRDAARQYAEHAIRVNPWRWQYHQTLAAILVQNEDWPQAIRECQKTLSLYGASLATRRLLVTSYLRSGDKAKAQAEFDVLLALSAPQHQETMRPWFELEGR